MRTQFRRISFLSTHIAGFSPSPHLHSRSHVQGLFQLFFSLSLPSEITESVDRHRNLASQCSMAIETPLVNATQSAKLFCVFAVSCCDFLMTTEKAVEVCLFLFCQQTRLKANKRGKKRKIKPIKLIQSFCFQHLHDFDFHELVLELKASRLHQQ